MTKSPNPNPPYQFVVKTPSRNVWPLDKPEQNEFEVADFSFFLSFFWLDLFCITNYLYPERLQLKDHEPGDLKKESAELLRKKEPHFFFFKK